jgi:ParB family transcriptional regulator, chromosome partitioning protein
MDNKRKGGLGRGLSAMLSNDVKDDIKKEIEQVSNINLLPVSQIETNPFQPRTEFEEEALNELADSIRVHGIIQPITVRKFSEGQYQLISGERRLRASKIAGLTEIPAYIRTANDEQMIEMALIENIQRQDLNPIEIALSYKRMMEELHLKQEELGDKVGKKRATVANFVRLLKLPAEIQIALRDRRISIGHAKPLITIENPIHQLSVFQDIMVKELSVRQTEELVRTVQNPQKAVPKKKEAATTNEILLRDLEGKLEDKFGNHVVLVQNTLTGKGEMKIAFNSTEDLNRIIELLEL